MKCRQSDGQINNHINFIFNKFNTIKEIERVGCSPVSFDSTVPVSLLTIIAELSDPPVRELFDIL